MTSSQEDKVVEIAKRYEFCEHMCEKIPRKAANENTKKAIREAISLTRKETEWIPVSAQIPFEGDWCIVVINGIVQITPCHRNEDLFFWAEVDADPCPVEEVSHWMKIELPSPPSSFSLDAGKEK